MFVPLLTKPCENEFVFISKKQNKKKISFFIRLKLKDFSFDYIIVFHLYAKVLGKL